MKQIINVLILLVLFSSIGLTGQENTIDTISVNNLKDSVETDLQNKEKLTSLRFYRDANQTGYIETSELNKEKSNDKTEIDRVVRIAQILFYLIIPIVSFLTYFQARRIAKNTSNLNKNAKKVDVMMVFHKRYDELKFEKKPNDKKSLDSGELTDELKNYYYRFWNLQLDQWQYSKLDFLDDEIYSHWLTLRRIERNNLSEIEKDVYDKGLEHAKKMISIDEFSEFIDKVVYGHEKTLKLIKLEKTNA